ncbi:MAG: DUF2147 domain-containing protein [Pseudomonadota bacterium]|nr:DUF2147 domain-containing protein [Pseudomonadota bacterium]
MKSWFLPVFAGVLLGFLPARSQASTTDPVGLWRTVDDKSGEVRGAVRLFENNGMIYGRVEQVIDPKAIDQVCQKCSGDRHNKPILGLDVIRGVRADGPGSWSGGEILDPETGDTYRVSLRLDDGGKKLVVRGSILGGMIGRSQTWVRASP